MLIAYVINRRYWRDAATSHFGAVIPVLHDIAKYELCALHPSECVWLVPGTWQED